MEANAERAWVESYLDGQLGPSEAALLEKAIFREPDLQAFIRTKRSFHDFLSKALLHVRPPDGLKERIRSRLANVAPISASVKRGESRIHARGVRWLRFAAALLMVCCGALIYQVFCPSLGLCRYVAACSREHRQIAKEPGAGIAPDVDLIRRLCSENGCPVAQAPEVSGYRLADAGQVSFLPLRSLGAPEAVFMRYQNVTGEPLILFLHSWPSETPTVERVVYGGRLFWFARYDGIGVACWKMRDGKTLCSLTGDLPKEQMLQLAMGMRVELTRQAGP